MIAHQISVQPCSDTFHLVIFSVLRPPPWDRRRVGRSESATPPSCKTHATLAELMRARPAMFAMSRLSDQLPAQRWSQAVVRCDRGRQWVGLDQDVTDEHPAR